MLTVSYEFLIKPEESAGCHHTLFSLGGGGAGGLGTRLPQRRLDTLTDVHGSAFLYMSCRGELEAVEASYSVRG